MAEPLAHDLRVDSDLQRVRGVRVPQIMKPNPGHSGETNAALEVVTEHRGMDRTAARRREHELAVIESRVTRFRVRQSSCQDLARSIVECDEPPTPFCFRRGDTRLMVDLDNCLDDM